MKGIFSYYFIEAVQEIKRNNAIPWADGNSSLFRFLFALTFVFLLFLMPILSVDFGRSTDETFSESYGRDILSYYESLGKDTAVFDLSKPSYKDLIYYGLSFDFFCAIINKYVSPFGDFETRHFLNALIGLLGMLIASLIGKRYGNWRTAWIILLLIAITPRYFAHSMNNAKDIPLATGYIAAIFFSLKFLDELPSPSRKTIVLLIISIGLASSIRIGGFILVAYLGLFLTIKWLNIYFKNKERIDQKKLTRTYFQYFFIIGLAAYVISIIFWPFALKAPLTNPLNALRMFEDSDLMMTHYEVFEGKLMNMDHVPWYYIFKYIWITIPIGVLIGVIASLAGFWKSSTKIKTVLLILIFVSVFPVFYAAIKSSKLYNGWRHFLFIYPSIAVLAGLGWNFLMDISSKKAIKIFLFLVLAALLIKPAAWMIKNHPNQIVYFNEIVGGTEGAYGYYETDYLSFSGREAAEWLAEIEKDNPNKILVATNIETQSLKYYSDKFTAHIDYVWVRPMTYSIYDWDYMILTSRSMSLAQIQNGQFPPKGTVHTISVGNVPLCAVVKKENDYKFRSYQMFINGNNDSSKYYLEKAIEYDPNDPEIYTLLGTTLTGLEQYDRAYKMLHKAIDLFPENFYAYDKLGVLFMRQEKNKKAIDVLRKSIQLRNNYSIAYVNLAGAFQNVKEYDSALHYYGIASLMNNNDVYTEINIAECLIAIKQYNKAFFVYDKILKNQPNHAETLAKKEELTSYMQNLHLINSMNTSIQDELLIAEEYMNNNQFDSVLSIFTKILEKDPENVLALVNRGVANLNLGHYYEALKDLEKAKSIDTLSHFLFYNLGLAYANTKQYKKAIDCYNKALQISPSDLGVLYERAKLNIYLKDFEAALKDCNTVLQIQPDKKETLYTRAWLSSTLNKKDAALSDLNRIIQIDPNFAIAYNLRSLIYYERKEYRKALTDVEKALALGYKIDPKFVDFLRKTVN